MAKGELLMTNEWLREWDTNLSKLNGLTTKFTTSGFRCGLSPRRWQCQKSWGMAALE
jgi:hypothetical protein